MTDPADPARTGIVAGRIVGVLTAGLVVVSLLDVQASFVGRIETTFRLLGIDPRGSVEAYFWLYLVSAAVGRYVLCYVVGSLIGVVYDWLEDPSPIVVVGIVLAVGLVDGFVARLDTRSTLVAAGYVAAWCCFVPAFYHYLEESESRWGETRRLGDE